LVQPACGCPTDAVAAGPGPGEPRPEIARIIGQDLGLSRKYVGLARVRWAVRGFDRTSQAEADRPVGGSCRPLVSGQAAVGTVASPQETLPFVLSRDQRHPCLRHESVVKARAIVGLFRVFTELLFTGVPGEYHIGAWSHLWPAPWLE